MSSPAKALCSETRRGELPLSPLLTATEKLVMARKSSPQQAKAVPTPEEEINFLEDIPCYTAADASGWSSWRIRFENLAALRKWTDEQGRRELRRRITGPAGVIVDPIPLGVQRPDDRTSAPFYILLDQYQDALETYEDKECAKSSLAFAVRQPTEEWINFMDRLTSTFMCCFTRRINNNTNLEVIFSHSQPTLQEQVDYLKYCLRQERANVNYIRLCATLYKTAAKGGAKMPVWAFELPHAYFANAQRTLPLLVTTVPQQEIAHSNYEVKSTHS